MYLPTEYLIYTGPLALKDDDSNNNDVLPKEFPERMKELHRSKISFKQDYLNTRFDGLHHPAQCSLFSA